jgi:hypothetical protein
MNPRPKLALLPALAAALAGAAHAQGPVQFTDATNQSGIAFVHTDRLDTMAGGTCFLDFDRDGDEDLFVTARGGGSNRLFANRGDGSFVDVTQAAGVGDRIETMGAYAADLDDDGWQDLVVLSRFRIALYRNNGDGTFTDLAGRSQLGRITWPTSASFGDYDRDGDLDIYVGCYIGEGFFPYFDGNPNLLLRNEGNFTFANVARQAGVEGIETFMDPRGYPRTTASCTLSVLFFDHDQDGWQDIFVGNDFGPFVIPNQLYRNLGNGRFEEVARAAGFRIAEFNMGLTTADVNGDGFPDLYTSNFGPNHLLLNDGRGRFFDVGASWNALEGQSNGALLVSWAAMFLDADLDARIDLYVSNGFIQAAPSMPADPNSPSHLLMHQGRGYLAAPESQIPWDRGVGRGAACADIDGDGDEDLIQLNNRQELKVYRNDTRTQNRAARLLLRGTLSNRDAVGARLRIQSRQHSTSLEYQRGGSYLSGNGAAVIRGLGEDPRIERLAVEWPSGVASERFGLPSDRVHEVVEPRVTAERAGPMIGIGDQFVQIDVDLRNHASSAEPVQLVAKIELGGTLYEFPAYHLPTTVGGRGSLTVPVYLPLAPAAIPFARQLGAWINIGVRDRDAGTDELEFPIR